MSPAFKVAIVQEAAVPFAIDAGIEAAVAHVKAAIDTGAKVIGFGEAFLGGYPVWLDSLPGPSLWDHPGTRELHALLLGQALRGNDPRLARLQWVVDMAGVVVSIGAHERVRSSLFSTQFLLRPKAPALLHRKLVPTQMQRMLWAAGDGSTLEVHEGETGRIGQLICNEHWMPLARAVMHHSGEAVHVAAWPTVTDVNLMASCHYAYEGRSFVLSAGSVLERHDLTAGLRRVNGSDAAAELLRRLPEGPLLRGRSAIVAPDGVVLAQAGERPTILTARLDLGEIDHGLATMDIDGHYARPDVFELRIDRRPRKGVVDAGDDSEAA